ncbi:SixA phosphatase family protein [Alteromonas oceanisediminis]|uniref:SixA phosphatase family protein n=1 Tax=Alteromonas oceanisediminis TaxID=2836180 RepID=UPI001BDB3D27|nr:histidine phosphatase family protein [Alteromonas oceanisediminis]MBT0587526.1 histidine phosphatase family protein [Alteromonas oceanisediminis]
MSDVNAQSTTRVVIIRHGEAEPAFSNDRARALTERGRQQVTTAMREIETHMSGTGAFDLALISPYRRTQQTYDILTVGLRVKRKIDCEQVTPMNSAKEAQWIVAGASDTCRSILVVSHMPLVSFLTAELCNLSSPPLFATSAFAVIDLVKANGIGQLITLNQQHD